MKSWNLSPSRLARFWQFDCDRYLRWASTPSAQRADEGIPAPPRNGSPIALAILEGGYLWEEQILSDHLAKRVVIAEGSGPLRDRAHSRVASLKLMADLEPGQWIYQPTLAIPNTFHERYGLDPQHLHFADCRPDLIEITTDPTGTKRLLRIHDAKASSHQKLTHRVQVALYALIIECILEEEGIEVDVAPLGGVWLSGAASPETFDLDRLRPGLTSWLKRRLPKLFEGEAREVFWHLNPRCEWCEWFDSCSAEATESTDVSLIPGLSTAAKRHLSEATPPVQTVDEFQSLLLDEERFHAIEEVASLAGRRARWTQAAKSITNQRAYPFGGTSLELPKFENIRFIITLQSEPVAGSIYAFGIHRAGGKKLFGEDAERTRVEVAASDSPADLLRLKQQFVASLFEILTTVHGFNEDQEWKQRQSIQCYAWDLSDAELVRSTLLELIEDPVAGPKALTLFFVFQSEDLMGAEAHPSIDAGPPPIVILSKVIQDLVALPIPVAYRFSEVNRLLQPKEFGSKYSGSDFHSFRLSNRMKSEAIHHIWRKDRADLIPNLIQEVSRRLRGADSILRGLRERLEAHPQTRLVCWAPKFTFPPAVEMGDPLLSRLAFMVRFEEVAACRELQARRALPRAERIARGYAVPLVRVAGGGFQVAPEGDDVVWEGSFPSFLLSPLTDEGEAAQMGFDDFRSRCEHRPKQRGSMAFAGIAERSQDSRHLQLEIFPATGFPTPQPGERFLLHERFTDYTTRRLLAELEELDEQVDTSWLHALITNPSSLRQAPTDLEQIQSDARGSSPALGFTPSQRAAFDGVLEHQLQLVWGPPGTGKTHFLAVAILALEEAYRKAGLPLRIMVTAFTHAAINHLLAKVSELAKGFPSCELSVAKVGGSRAPGFSLSRSNSGVEFIEREDTLSYFRTHQRCVVGGTVWSWQKAIPAHLDSPVNLLIVDEASQVRVPDAAIPLRRLAPNARIVLAGDHRQLPPIIKGKYPEPTGVGPKLHRSLFDAVRAADLESAAKHETESATAMLLESWRLNDELCRLPAETLYDTRFRPATEVVAKRRLRLDPQESLSDFASEALNPEHPLVLVILEGVRATTASPKEAERVAELALALRSACDLPESAEGDAEFWREHLFVVTPHHDQRRAVLHALEQRRAWQAPPFVDTVDKMQGQECETVIVSYGVSDTELALQEAAFIYGLERLNVAITRARSKCVVFLPEPLLHPPLAAFEDDAIAAGVAFMQSVERYANTVIRLRE